MESLIEMGIESLDEVKDTCIKSDGNVSARKKEVGKY
jgi:hypothetical protein